MTAPHIGHRSSQDDTAVTDVSEGNARITDGEHLREWVQAASDLVRSVNAERPVSTLLTTVAEQARALLGLDMCGVFLADDTGAELVIQGSSGLSERYLERLHAEHPLLVGPGGDTISPSAHAYRTGRTVAIPNVRTSGEMGPWRQLALQEGYEALIATPLREGERTVGVIVGYALKPRPFPEAQVEMLSMFAVHAGTALQAARLRDSAQEMIAELRRQRHSLEAIDQQHRRLMQVMANDVGLNGVVNMLAELLGGSVTLDDAHGGQLASATRGAYLAPPRGAERDLKQVRDALDEVTRKKTGCVEIRRGPGRAHTFWVAPVALGNGVTAYLWVGGPGLIVDDLGKIAIERFAMALALELSKLRHAAQLRLRLSRDLMADLLSPVKQADCDALIERATAMGHDLTAAHQVLLTRPDDKQAGTAPGQGLLEVADAIVRKHAPGSIVGGIKGEAVVLVKQDDHTNSLDANPPRASTAEVAKLIQAEYRRRNPTRTASLVLGGIANDISDIAGHYRSARGASRLGAHRHDAIIDIRDLGVAALLLTHGDNQALEAFARQSLGPVLEHDVKRKSELVSTLRAWLAADCHTARTAEQLIVHANTVNYRLKTAEELLGQPLRSQGFLVELDIALMILDVVGATEPD